MTTGTLRSLSILALAALIGCDDGGESEAAGEVGLAPAEDATPGEDDGGESPGEDGGLEEDAGDEPTGCEADDAYALAHGPKPVSEQAVFAARLIWTGAEFGALWQRPGADEVNQVLFQRFDFEGGALGEPTELGVARLPQQELLFNGSGYVAVWKSTRGPQGGVDAIRIQALSAAGDAIGPGSEIEGTFDVEQLSAAWAPLGGGMIAYTRGRNGADGLHIARLDEGAQPAAPRTIIAEASQNPAVIYGDAAWGLAWLDPASAAPADVVFMVVDDQGTPVSPIRRIAEARAISRVFLGFKGQTYALGWTANTDSGPTARTNLYTSPALEELLAPGFEGPKGFGLVTGLGSLDPDSFGVAWQDTHEGRTSVGFTRVGPDGSFAEPVRVEAEQGSLQGLRVGGNVSRVGGIYVDDPEPPPAGGFSDAVRARVVVFEKCD